MKYKIVNKLNEGKKIPIIPKNLKPKSENNIKKIEMKNEEVIIFLEYLKNIDDVKILLQISERMIQYMIAIYDFSVFQNVNNYVVEYFVEKSGNWKHLYPEKTGKLENVDFQKKIIDDSFENISDFLNGKKEIPFSLILLKNTKSIEGLSEKFVSIITACEIGVKEFYKEQIPGASILLEEIQSPPVVKLLGTMFENYFSEPFPSELRKKIDKYIRIRNKIVHSSSVIPTIDEVFDCYISVLRTLNFLNNFSKNEFYNFWYDENVEFIPCSYNTGRLVSSDVLQEEISKGNLELSVKLKLLQGVNFTVEEEDINPTTI